MVPVKHSMGFLRNMEYILPGIGSQHLHNLFIRDKKTTYQMYHTDETAKTGDQRLLYWFIPPVKRTSSSYADV